MRLTDRNKLNSQTGFTLIEVMLVLILVSLVFAGVFQFFFYTHKSYAYADAQSEVVQDINLLFTQLEKDIRSASEPNNNTKAIRILNDGKQLDVYHFNKDTSTYERISYRFNNNKIERGFISTTTPDTNANPQYGTIPNSGSGGWTTILSNHLPGNPIIFSDNILNEDISSRRLIDVDVYVKHPKLNDSINMNTTIMSRTGKSTTSIETSDASNQYVPVTGINIDPSEKFVNKSGDDNILITATVDPVNATNKNLLWSQQLNSLLWMDFTDFLRLYDDGTGITDAEIDLNPDLYRDRVTSRSGSPVRINIDPYKSLGLPGWFGLPDPRTTTIKITSPDIPNAPVYLTVKQHKNK